MSENNTQGSKALGNIFELAKAQGIETGLESLNISATVNFRDAMNKPAEEALLAYQAFLDKNISATTAGAPDSPVFFEVCLKPITAAKNEYVAAQIAA